MNGVIILPEGTTRLIVGDLAVLHINVLRDQLCLLLK